MTKDLDEAAKLYQKTHDDDTSVGERDAFISGAYWMEERMFSPEDMFEFAGYIAGVKLVTPEKDPAEVFAFWVHKYKTDKIVA